MSKDHAQQRTEYLRDNDAPCPRCAYNLRNSPSHRCPECGLDFSQIPVTHLQSIYTDAKLERRLIRIALVCILIVGPVACVLAYAASIRPFTLMTIAGFITAVACALYADRTTTLRHIRASSKSLYDGTTGYGTLALLIVAIMGFPTVLIVVKLLHEFAG
jgi:hypothetical protein